MEAQFVFLQEGAALPGVAFGGGDAVQGGRRMNWPLPPSPAEPVRLRPGVGHGELHVLHPYEQPREGVAQPAVAGQRGPVVGVAHAHGHLHATGVRVAESGRAAAAGAGVRVRWGPVRRRGRLVRAACAAPPRGRRRPQPPAARSRPAFPRAAPFRRAVLIRRAAASVRAGVMGGAGATGGPVVSHGHTGTYVSRRRRAGLSPVCGHRTPEIPSPRAARVRPGGRAGWRRPCPPQSRTGPRRRCMAALLPEPRCPGLPSVGSHGRSPYGLPRGPYRFPYLRGEGREAACGGAGRCTG